MRLLLTVPAHVTAEQLFSAMDQLGVTLYAQPNSQTVVGFPVSPERHGNTTVRKIPRERWQPRHPDPEVA